MESICFRKEISGDVNTTIERLTRLLQEQGFGILTRIDFHTKMKEKLGKEVPPTVILGACNPKMAHEAYSRSQEVLGLLPCNAVVREIAVGRVAVELTKPTELLSVLRQPELTSLASDADSRLQSVLQGL